MYIAECTLSFSPDQGLFLQPPNKIFKEKMCFITLTCTSLNHFEALAYHMILPNVL